MSLKIEFTNNFKAIEFIKTKPTLLATADDGETFIEVEYKIEHEDMILYDRYKMYITKELKFGSGQCNGNIVKFKMYGEDQFTIRCPMLLTLTDTLEITLDSNLFMLVELGKFIDAKVKINGKELE